MKNRLNLLEENYLMAGPLGCLWKNKLILPLRKRLESGETSKELHDEIMNLPLLPKGKI